MNQVIVEDRRSCKDPESPQLFDALPYDCLFVIGGGSTVCRKLRTSNRSYEQITGDHVGHVYIASDSARCRPLPHLRLRMILEDAKDTGTISVGSDTYHYFPIKDGKDVKP